MKDVDVTFPADESCPDCGGKIFRPGPRGGLSQNIECVGCGSRFNVTRWQDYERTRAGRIPPIVWAHRIPSERDGGGAWREDMFPRVLQ
jgi:hypothetical protein